MSRGEPGPRGLDRLARSVASGRSRRDVLLGAAALMSARWLRSPTPALAGTAPPAVLASDCTEAKCLADAVLRSERGSAVCTVGGAVVTLKGLLGPITYVAVACVAAVYVDYWIGVEECPTESVDLLSDPANCGTCGHTCAPRQICRNGHCHEPTDPIPPCLDCGGQDGTCCHEPDEFCCLSDDNVNFVCCPDSACSCVKPLPPGGITCADGRADCGPGVCCDAAQFCCEVDREGQLLQFCVERGGLCQ